jgi:hypothetical protein
MLVVSLALNRDALAQMFASLHLLNVDVAVTLMALLQYKKNIKIRIVVLRERLIYFRKTFEKNRISTRLFDLVLLVMMGYSGKLK